MRSELKQPGLDEDRAVAVPRAPVDLERSDDLLGGGRDHTVVISEVPQPDVGSQRPRSRRRRMTTQPLKMTAHSGEIDLLTEAMSFSARHDSDGSRPTLSDRGFPTTTEDDEPGITAGQRRTGRHRLPGMSINAEQWNALGQRADAVGVTRTAIDRAPTDALDLA